MLRAPLDVWLLTRAPSAFLERFLHALQELLSLPPARLDEVRDLAVGPGVERLEREVLELPFQLLHAEAVRERRGISSVSFAILRWRSSESGASVPC